MDCSCCCAYDFQQAANRERAQNTEIARRAIDGENLQYFSNKKWTSKDYEGGIRNLFIYSLTRISSWELRRLLLAGCLKVYTFPAMFEYLVADLRFNANVLILLLQLKPTNIDMAKLRFGYARRSVLHLCAEAGNETWIRYFIDNLEFKFQPLCWGDRHSLTPLHYAAKNGHLEVVQYLVSELGQSPTQQSPNRRKNTTPWEIAADGPVKDFLQFYLEQRGDLRPQARAVEAVRVDAAINSPEPEETAPPTERSPLLGRKGL